MHRFSVSDIFKTYKLSSNGVIIVLLSVILNCLLHVCISQLHMKLHCQGSTGQAVLKATAVMMLCLTLIKSSTIEMHTCCYRLNISSQLTQTRELVNHFTSIIDSTLLTKGSHHEGVLL